MYTYDINIAELTVMNILNKVSIRFRIREPHVSHELYLFDNQEANDPEHHKYNSLTSAWSKWTDSWISSHLDAISFPFNLFRW